MLNKIALISVCNTNLCIEISAQFSCIFVELSYNKMIRVWEQKLIYVPKDLPFSTIRAVCPSQSFPVHLLLPDTGFPLMSTHCIALARTSAFSIQLSKLSFFFHDRNIA